MGKWPPIRLRPLRNRLGDIRRGQHAEDSMTHCYLFGARVLPCRPSADGEREIFVLGAYPSALHVKWCHPDGKMLIKAIAVANEPTPFWTGEDQNELRRKWTHEQGIRPEWGTFGACEGNGSSGRKLDDMLFNPLKISRTQAWITDCLDEYHQSTSAQAAMSRGPVAKMLIDHGIIMPVHRAHPTEGQIVAMARQQHHRRLLEELAVARPKIVVTLGNAALKVFCELAKMQEAPIRLSSDPLHYGRTYGARIGERAIEWLPLAHPAAPESYRQAHRDWLTKRLNKSVS